MKNFIKILEKEKMIWIEVERKNAKEFLKIVNSMDFVWLNGKNIDFENDKPFFHLSLESNKILSNVAMFAWLSPESKNIKKLTYEEFINLIQ